MHSKKDYEHFANMIGVALGCARNEDERTFVYESIYEPTVAYFRSDNDRFDQLRFSYATGVAEGNTRSSINAA